MFIQKKEKQDQNAVIVECSCYSLDHIMKVVWDSECQCFYLDLKMLPGKGLFIKRVTIFGVKEPKILCDVRYKFICVIKYINRLKRALLNQSMWDTSEILIPSNEAHELVQFMTSKIGDKTNELGDAGNLG